MAHNRRVLVFGAVNYGASKTNAAANSALNPADLAVGAVGVYGIHETGSTNLNKLVLIVNGGSEGTGTVPAGTFQGKEVQIFQGTALSAGGSAERESGVIGFLPTKGVQRCTASVYVAPVRGVLRIGWNGTVGSSLNFPSVVNRGDDFIIELFNRNYLPAGVHEPGQKVILSGQAQAGDTAYTLVGRLITSVNNRYAKSPVGDQLLIDPLLLKVITNGTGSVFSNSATVALTKGSTAVTTSAVHGVTVGQWIILNGDLYQAAVVPTTSTITLDRPWQQATVAALANASAINTGSTTVPTQIGLELVDNQDYRNVEAAVQGDAVLATITRFTRPTPGSGANAEIVALEKEFLGDKGSQDQLIRYMPLDSIYSQISGLNYDIYIFEIHNYNDSHGDNGSVFRTLKYAITCFPAGVANTGGFNQADFEDIMQSLYTSTVVPTIS